MAEGQNRSNDGGNSSERGFAAMDDEKQREIASEGGSVSGGNFKNDPQRAAEAGREGGRSTAENRSGGSTQGSRPGGDNASRGSQGGQGTGGQSGQGDGQGGQGGDQGGRG